MKILWISNTIFPDLSEFLEIDSPIFGGWMYGLANRLSLNKNIKLAVAATYSGSNVVTHTLGNIEYFLLPCKNNRKFDNKLKLYWKQIVSTFQPDVIHIHGTEYPHGLACMLEFPNYKYVISIQGLVGVYSRYYFASIPWFKILLNITFRDLIKTETLFQTRQSFVNQGILEKNYLLSTKNVIGRTNWDFVHSKSVNPKVRYHFCNESLRDSFYEALKWDYENCEPFSIFLSQAGYPIKGLHQVLRAVSNLKQEYPKLKIKIAGDNIIRNTSILDRIKRTGYGKYIYKLIVRYNLEGSVLFLGPLSEEQIIVEYQKANLFICPSSIENSPNSLGEAQLLGVPVVAAYVGGIPDMVENNQTGLLYRFEEIEMMANCIRTIFNDKKIAQEMSKKSIVIASKRHDRVINYDETISIYKKIISN